MLDYHFPDEHVRQFAVNALDKMPDDQLEDILLQLTQVCVYVCVPSSVCVCVCLSVCLSVGLSVCLCIYLSVFTYILCITVVNLLSLPQNVYIRK